MTLVISADGNVSDFRGLRRTAGRLRRELLDFSALPEPSDQTLSRAEDAPSTGGTTGAHLIVGLECDRPMSGGARFVIDGLESLEIGRSPERTTSASPKEAKLRLGVPDSRMSSAHLALRKLRGRWMAEDLGSKNGVFLNGEKIESSALRDGDILEIGHTLFLFFEDRPGSTDLDAKDLADIRPELRTFVDRLRREVERLSRVAKSDLSVLILGESGTGKEILARIIHETSERSGRFVAVNCGAIPEHLVEAEFFGVRKGAYSGADRDRAGLVESAHLGTLFLDELGELPRSSQAALLRVIQEREVTRVGDTQPVGVDFRLLAATHRDIGGMVDAEEFRGDLLARVSQLKLALPPLRERKEDLGLLIPPLLQSAGGTDARFTPRAGRALFQYDWPFNIRELAHCLKTAVVLAEGGLIQLEHLPDVLQTAAAPGAPALSEAQDQHKAELEALLLEHGGNLAAVSRTTGKARMQLHRWIKRYGIDPAKYRK